MSNDERREKRVQASLRVRYKSATVTDFIEKHCHDISPGGVFIRSQKPLAKGSLLKIDFRLEDDTAVIQGVGRVVWTREDSGEGKPAGMGIKFIRLDANSEENIHKIIAVQKAGREITRESVLGGEMTDDTDGGLEIPVGIDMPEGTAPSVESLEADDTASDVSVPPTDAVESGKQVTDVSDVAGEAVDAQVETDEGADSELRPDKPSIPPATVFPAEEEKGSHWGIVLVVALIVAGAMVFILTRTPKNESGSDASHKKMLADTGAADESAAAADSGEEASQPVETGAVANAVTADSSDAAIDTPDADGATAADTAGSQAIDADEAMDSAVDSGKAAEAPAAIPTGGPASGEVTITLNEPEAAIAIDGVPYKDGAPVTLASLPAGDHILTATLFGFKPLEAKFTAVAGEPLTLAFKLKRTHIVTTLKANVIGVEVYVEGKKVATTPTRLKKRFDQSFAYRFSKTGFEDFNGSVKPTDWVYEGGVYRLLLDVTLAPKDQTPSAN